MIFYNQTQFIIDGVRLGPVLQMYIGVALTLVYNISLGGNLLSIFIISVDQSLNTPMYFFLRGLAILDIVFISSTIPKLLSVLMRGDKYISLCGCLTQLYVYIAVGSIEFHTLGLLSLDRYLAICNPLQYSTIMTSLFCWKIIVCLWMVAILENIPVLVLMSQLQWSDGVIDHFFCDVSVLLKLSCSDTQVVEHLFLFIACFTILSSFILTILSYCFILISIMRISSSDGRTKTFSTCSSHFVAVLLAYGSCIFIYVCPAQSYSYRPGKIVAVFNSIVIPLVHPFIYCLRNQVVLTALKCFFRKKTCL